MRFRLRKGVIFRQLYLTRKELIGIAGAALSITVLGLLVRLSMRVGNLSHLAGTSDFDDIEMMTYYILTSLPAVIISVLMNDLPVITNDAKCGWLRFTKTLPMSAAEQSAHIYIVKLVMWAAAFAYSLANLALFCAVSGRSFDTLMVRVILVITAIGAFVSSLQTTVMLFFKKENRAAAVTFFMIMAIFISAEGAAVMHVNALISEMGISADSDNADLMPMMERLRDDLLSVLGGAAALSPVIILVSFATGFFLAKKALERKEG